MSLTREFNLHDILETNIAKRLLNDDDIKAYAGRLSRDNQAALLHFNGVVDSSDEQFIERKRLELQLVAAFGNKDLERIKKLVFEKKVSVCVRLDYGLPLFDPNFGAGEDIFVAATKALLGGGREKGFTLPPNAMMHKTGETAGQFYAAAELEGIAGYVDNSFEIQEALAHPDNNRTPVDVNIEAFFDILQKAATYRDSNNNPVIVFIPGATSIPEFSAADIINYVLKTVEKNVNINDIGFFGVTGIVWSIILADVQAVRQFIDHQASLTIQDEMGNNHVMFWAAATYKAMTGNTPYQTRMLQIMEDLGGYKVLTDIEANFIGNRPWDYLDDAARAHFKPVVEQQQSPYAGLARLSKFAQQYSPTPSESEEEDQIFLLTRTRPGNAN